MLVLTPEGVSSVQVQSILSMPVLTNLLTSAASQTYNVQVTLAAGNAQSSAVAVLNQQSTGC